MKAEIVVLLLVAAAAAATRNDSSCPVDTHALESVNADDANSLYGHLCRFTLLNSLDERLIIGAPLTPLTGPIVLNKNGRYVRVRRSRQAEVETSLGFKTIRAFGQVLFNEFALRTFKGESGRSGIGHQDLNPVQALELHNKCIVLPFKKYVLKASGNLPEKTVGSQKKSDCVAFRPILTFIQLELTWASHASLRLIVKEPSGFKLSSPNKLNPSTGGEYREDLLTTSDTDTVRENRQVVFYPLDAAIERGTYKVKVRTTGWYSDPETIWNSRIYQKGVLLKTMFTGSTGSADSPAVLESFTFVE